MKYQTILMHTRPRNEVMYENLQKLGESSEVVNQIYDRLEPETQMLLPKKSSLTRWVNEIPGVKTHTAQNNSSAFGLYVRFQK